MATAIVPATGSRSSSTATTLALLGSRWPERPSIAVTSLILGLLVLAQRCGCSAVETKGQPCNLGLPSRRCVKLVEQKAGEEPSLGRALKTSASASKSSNYPPSESRISPPPKTSASASKSSSYPPSESRISPPPGTSVASPIASSIASPSLFPPTGSSAPAQPPECEILLDRSLLIACRTVLRHSMISLPGLLAAFPAKPRCVTAIGNIRFAPDGLIFYYVVESYYELGGKRSGESAMFMKGNLSGVRQGVEQLASQTLISHSWVPSMPDGPPPSDPLIYGDGIPTPSVVYVDGIELSKQGTHLLLSAYTVRGNASWITSLDVANGFRTSIRVPADTARGLAFDQNKTCLYIGDKSGLVPRILSAKVDGPDRPTTAELAAAVAVALAPWNSSAAPRVVNPPFFGSRSFSKDGSSCLYFIDREEGRVWGFEPASRRLRGITRKEAGVSDLTDCALLALFRDGSLGEVATTSDGVNVFVTDASGILWWITLDAPCGCAREMEVAARFEGGGFRGLAISEDDQLLYVGTTSGLMLEISVNTSSLSRKVATPPPSSPPESQPTICKEGGSNPSSAVVSSFPTPPLESSEESRRRGNASTAAAAAVVIPVLGSVILLTCFGAIFMVIRARSRKPNLCIVSGRNLCSISRKYALIEPNPHTARRFSFQSLSQWTRDFSSPLGEEGAFGRVYWGELEEKRGSGKVKKQQIAVKVMEGSLTPGMWQQFITEVDTLTRVHHANLCELIGYCEDGKRPILVYPYKSGGSLHARLHQRPAGRQRHTSLSSSSNLSSSTPNQSCPTGCSLPGVSPEEETSPGQSLRPLTLKERILVASHVGNAVRYLHKEVDPPIFHCDIKSLNVLLNDGVGEALRAFLADFGMAKIGETVTENANGEANGGFASTLRGTVGYLAPECLSGGEVTEKTDVYSFGVLLLEILTGRNAIENDPLTNRWKNIVHWAKACFDRPSFETIERFLDPSLEDEMAKDTSLRSVAVDAFTLASQCVELDPDERPEMGDVAQRIDRILSTAAMGERWRERRSRSRVPIQVPEAESEREVEKKVISVRMPLA
ncbi:hypothetical protein CBR_g51811 [Chara braunii]|uniref:Protein kinase domain-containing protein n=1 Tax=Chara braunii TaxID=69332 RepID=A0A388M908_CHABU|nr:hypothetical protein CBR_g51811 [Chara braunii]|eukprot:GBG91077.1 hypothetical protein CBR_g51811 [Chara braunii]